MSAFVHAFRMPLALTLLALLASFGHARAGTDPAAAKDGPPREIYVDIGATGRALYNVLPDAGDFYGFDWAFVTGFEVGVGARLTHALVVEVRADALWREDILSFGGRAAALIDLDWEISPVIGPWLGYRYTHAAFDGYTSTFNLGPAPPRYHYAGTVDGYDVSGGLEAGVRGRSRRFTAALTAQWGAALGSTRETHHETDYDEVRAEKLTVGDASDVGVTLRAGVRW